MKWWHHLISWLFLGKRIGKPSGVAIRPSGKHVIVYLEMPIEMYEFYERTCITLGAKTPTGAMLRLIGGAWEVSTGKIEVNMDDAARGIRELRNVEAGYEGIQ